MPPKKRYVLSTTVRWSYFDIAMFRYLNQITGRDTNKILRDATRSYARKLSSFSSESFVNFARKSLLPEIQEPMMRAGFLAELRTFAEAMDSDENIESFTASARDFH